MTGRRRRAPAKGPNPPKVQPTPRPRTRGRYLYSTTRALDLTGWSLDAYACCTARVVFTAPGQSWVHFHAPMCTGPDDMAVAFAVGTAIADATGELVFVRLDHPDAIVSS